MAGKGDKRRPSAVSRETYEENYDRIFRSEKNDEQEECEEARVPDKEAEIQPHESGGDSGDCGQGSNAGPGVSRTGGNENPPGTRSHYCDHCGEFYHRPEHPGCCHLASELMGWKRP